MDAEKFFSPKQAEKRFKLGSVLGQMGEERLKALLLALDEMQDPVFIVDQEAKLCYFNKGYYLEYQPLIEEQLGVSIQNRVEKLVGIDLNAMDKEGTAPVLQVMETGEPQYQTSFYGNERYFSDIYPIRIENTVIGALVICRDMTTIAEMSQQIKCYQALAEGLRYEANRKDDLPSPFLSVIGSSPQFVKLLHTAAQVAPTNASVCITGESGTGKEVLANAIHFSSKFAGGPFVKVNCAAIPESLMESELFGYEKGAFTGARATGNPGKFELANHGTLFLDEIGEMPLSMQVKLLRALQEHEITRVGGNKPIQLKFRLITATNRNLKEMIREGTFREDLYYRINVVTLRLPPLRERRSDIPLLLDHFLQEMKDVYGGEPTLTGETMALMTRYDWPGNIREMKNCVERMVVMSDSDQLTPDLLPQSWNEFNRAAPLAADTSYRLQPILQQVEYETICKALEASAGHKGKAIDLLGISKRSFYMKLEKYHIK